VDWIRVLHAATRAQAVEQLRFSDPDALLGPQDLRLVLLQLRRHEPLRPRHRLATLVFRRHPREMRSRHFDVVAEDLVEADLE